MANMQERINTTDARQASPRKMNLRVLLGSLMLALLAGYALYVGYSQGPRIEQSPTQQEKPQQ